MDIEVGGVQLKMVELIKKEDRVKPYIVWGDN